MIGKIADHVVSELNTYFGLLASAQTDQVAAGSLFDLDGTPNAKVKDKLVFSLVNIEQDRTYHSLDVYKKNGRNDIEITKPELKVNLFFLLIANHGNYQEALKSISRAIAFFQHRHSFDIDPMLPTTSSGRKNHIVVEMISMSFEQQNHLWGMLGGKYMPSVMFKAGIADIRDERVEGEVAPVEEVVINRGQSQ